MAGGDALAVLLPIVVGVALVSVAALVVRHGQGHRHNLFFAALYTLSGLKSFSEGIALLGDVAPNAPPFLTQTAFWQFLALFAGIGLLPLLVLFVASFPHPAKWLQRRGAVALVASPAVVLVSVILLVVVGALPGEAYVVVGRLYNLLLVAATVGTIAWLVRVRNRSADAIERTQAFYVLVGFLPAFVLGWAVTGTQELGRAGALDPAAAEATVLTLVNYVSPILELAACSIIAFAILKYNILGIDPKFRLGVKSALVGALFAALFLMTQAVENLVLQGKVFSFIDDYTRGTGSFLLSGVTGLVLFKPFERASERVSNRLLPRQGVEEGSRHAEDIYHAQAAYVLRDAKVTDRELAFLRNLRQQLGLSEATARRIEEQVERILEVDDARLGQQAVGGGAAPAPAPRTAPGPAARPTAPASLGHAQRQAAAVAGSGLQVTRGAKAPPRPAPAAAPAAPQRPAAAPAAAKPAVASRAPAPAAPAAPAKAAGKAAAGPAKGPAPRPPAPKAAGKPAPARPPARKGA